MVREVITHGETFRFRGAGSGDVLESAGVGSHRQCQRTGRETPLFHRPATQRQVTPVFWFAHARTAHLRRIGDLLFWVDDSCIPTEIQV